MSEWGGKKVVFFFPPSQPVLICRQCPGYKADVSQLIFTTGSNSWFPAVPASASVPPPSKPAASEGCTKAAGEQPSTSSDVPSGDGKYHLLNFSIRRAARTPNMAVTAWQFQMNFSNPCFFFFVFFFLQPCVQLLRSIAAPLGASTSFAPAASSRCQTDGPSSAASRSRSNVSGSPAC